MRRRLALLAALTGALALAGSALQAAGALAAKGDVLVYSYANNGTEGKSAAAVLRSLGYTVTLTGQLPSSLTPYSAVWAVMAYAGFSPEQQEELEGYLREGGRVYLTGERPCCEELDLSDQAIARAVLQNQGVVVGQQGDVPGQLTFNAQAEDRITQLPNVLTQFPADAPGGMAGIGGIEARNVLAGNGSVPTGAVFDERDMADGRGRLVIYMDVDWLSAPIYGNGGEGAVAEDARPRPHGSTRPAAAPAVVIAPGGGGEETAAQQRVSVIENIQDFLEKTPRRTPPVSSEYVGLGDSYASGLGSFEYLPGTTGKNGCYRATHGYISDLAEANGLSLDFAACAGATTVNLWEGAGAQLKQVRSGTRFVTLSIGGNDVGFSSVLQSCIGGLYSNGGGKGCAARDEAGAEEALGWLRDGREPGKYELPGNKATSVNHQRLPSLPELYETILAQAPEAQLVVVGYPQLFETAQPGYKDCQVGTAGGLDKLTIAAADVEWISRENNRLDELIAQSVEAASLVTGGRAHFADPRPFFYGHGICDIEETFINPLLFEGFVPHPKNESFHPTKTGQEMLEAAILGQLAF